MSRMISAGPAAKRPPHCELLADGGRLGAAGASGTAGPLLVGRRAVVAGAVSLALVAWGRNSWADTSDPDPNVGKLEVHNAPVAVPALSWVDAAGATHRLADYAGKGVVLNFWATWCGLCVTEMPSLAALAAAVAGDGIVVLPVSADSGGAATVAHFFAAHHVAGLGVFLDPTMAAMTAAQATGLPTTLIVNRAGKEAARIAGAADWAKAGTVQTVRVLCA